MDFKMLYNYFSKLHFNCDITNLFKIKKIFFGQTIIFDVIDKNNIQLIIKIIPDFILCNVRSKPDFNQLEINFYQFFTHKYLLTDRTPHIVGLYNHQNCSRIDKLLRNIKIKSNTKLFPTPDMDKRICDLMLRHEMKILDPLFDVMLLEHCDEVLSNFIGRHIQSNSPAGNCLAYDLERILFQIIFTLAIIKEDYPGFLHGDFFMTNILLSYEKKYKPSDFVAYHYKQKIFYLEANGIYAKINDFGMTIIANELEPNIKLYHKNPFDQKSDIFSLLSDIYRSQNFKIEHIKKFIGKFIRTNENDSLENIVDTPNNYLQNNYFVQFQNLQTGANIVRHFNMLV
jgi:hypothetical protein